MKLALSVFWSKLLAILVGFSRGLLFGVHLLRFAELVGAAANETVSKCLFEVFEYVIADVAVQVFVIVLHVILQLLLVGEGLLAFVQVAHQHLARNGCARTFIGLLLLKIVKLCSFVKGAIMFSRA